MTIQQFKTILNKLELNRVDKSIFVYIMRTTLGFSNDFIASRLNETKGSVSKMYGQAKTKVTDNDVLFKLCVNFVQSEVIRLDFDKESRIEKLKKINSEIKKK